MAHAERCPVCNGKGVVPSDFYEIRNKPMGYYDGGTTTGMQQPAVPCRSCGGTGVVNVPDGNGYSFKPTWTGDWEYTNEEGPTLGNTSDHTS